MNDAYWMKMAEDVAQYTSLDESRKSGCVFVQPPDVVINGIPVSELMLTTGANNFPPQVNRTPERLQRPAKYVFTEHAERTAIYTAAAMGVSLRGATAYVNWYPCAECARALVLSGITRLVCYEPDWTETRYGFHDAKIILDESHVQVDYVGQKQEKAK